MFFRTVLVSLAILSLGPFAAHADSPYFTETVSCALPGGSTGQMRILRGDGLIAADPASVLVLDKDNRLLAFVDTGPSVFLSVNRNKQCVALDPAERRVFEADPNSFQRASAARVVRIENGRPDFYPGNMLSSWGFTVRPMSLSENVVALLRLMVRRPLAPIVLTLMSIWAVRLGVSIVGQFGSEKGVLARVIGGSISAIGIACLSVFAFMWMTFGEGISEIGLMSFGLGAAIFFTVRSLMGRLRVRSGV